MEGTVIRNGMHQGELFVEVQHFPDGSHASPLNYAVPVTAELPLGAVVDIVVTVKSVPTIPSPSSELTGTDVSTGFKSPESTRTPAERLSAAVASLSRTQPGVIREGAPVVPKSPLVGDTPEPMVDTSPSGQSQTPPEETPHSVPPRTLGDDETISKKKK